MISGLSPSQYDAQAYYPGQAESSFSLYERPSTTAMRRGDPLLLFACPATFSCLSLSNALVQRVREATVNVGAVTFTRDGP